MKFSLIILLAILSCIPIAKNISFKKNVQFSEIENINYFKWKKRILIIIDEENKTTKKIRRFSKEFEERDMLIITIKENNWLGEGKSLAFDIAFDEESLSGELIYSDPNYDFLGNSLYYSIALKLQRE